MFLSPGSLGGKSTKSLINIIKNNLPAVAPVPTLLNTLTAANSVNLQDLTSFGTGGFSFFELVFQNLVPVTNAVTLFLQVHSGGIFQSTNYLQATIIWSSTAQANAGNTGFVQLSSAAGAGNVSPGLGGSLRIFNPASTTIKKNIVGLTSFITNAGTFGGVGIACTWNGGTGAIDGFQVAANTGNLASGAIEVWAWP